MSIIITEKKFPLFDKNEELDLNKEDNNENFCFVLTTQLKTSDVFRKPVEDTLDKKFHLINGIKSIPHRNKINFMK